MPICEKDYVATAAPQGCSGPLLTNMRFSNVSQVSQFQKMNCWQNGLGNERPVDALAYRFLRFGTSNFLGRNGHISLARRVNCTMIL